MSTYPDVSVVMGVYNGASHLAATLDSILSQDGVELEFIVVNDGSTDESAAHGRSKIVCRLVKIDIRANARSVRSGSRMAKRLGRSSDRSPGGAGAFRVHGGCCSEAGGAIASRAVADFCLTYNRSKSLQRTLDSLAVQVNGDSGAIELLIIDIIVSTTRAGSLTFRESLPVRRVTESRQERLALLKPMLRRWFGHEPLGICCG
jgi:hypothetical protein